MTNEEKLEIFKNNIGNIIFVKESESIFLEKIKNVFKNFYQSLMFELKDKNFSPVVNTWYVNNSLTNIYLLNDLTKKQKIDIYEIYKNNPDLGIAILEEKSKNEIRTNNKQKIV